MHIASRATGARRLPAAALILALSAGPVLAQPVPAEPAPGAATVPPPNGNGCSPMMARWQSAEAAYSALKPADLDAFNVAQNAIDRAAHLCEAGNDAATAKVMAESARRPPDLQDFDAKVSP